jgi:hypothetical protein
MNLVIIILLWYFLPWPLALLCTLIMLWCS